MAVIIIFIFFDECDVRLLNYIQIRICLFHVTTWISTVRLQSYRHNYPQAKKQKSENLQLYNELI